MLDIQEVLEKIKNLPDRERLAVLKDLEILQEKTLAQKAQLHFLDFVKLMWPSFIAGRHHAKMADAFERVARGELKRLIINMPPRHRLDLNEKIPTTSGWKTVETVEVGDYVFSPDGSPVLVTGKSDIYEEDIYEVVTSDSQVVACDGEHLWTVRFGSNDKPFSTLSTREILHKLETESWRKSGNLPLLPRVLPVQYPERDLPIDPYVLGVWLGDGAARAADIGCSHFDATAMRAQVEACGYVTTANPNHQKFYIKGLLVQLRALGLLGNKHIPEAYLCASVEQRKALLQGLIDTDGDVTKEGKITFNNSNERLIDDVLCLVHSFGLKARKTSRQTHYKGKPSQLSYRIMFKMAGAARLPRKAERCRDIEGNWSRSIDIRKTERRTKVRCLEVANEDGLFLAGRGYVCTHNTKSEFASYLFPAWFLGKFPHKKIIQTAHTAELAVGFGRKVRNLIGGEDFQKVFPGISLSSDSKAAGRWNTNKSGDYFAIGIGGAVTGKGADVLVIDDPHSEQEAQLGEFNPEVYDKVYEWYTSGPRQRLQPGGAIIIVMCMTGDTDVLMADGSEKKLRNVRVGDFVATYGNGKVSAARITNFQSSGVDNVFTIKTRSGRILRANEDHPFLVEKNGERKWARLRHLKAGMSLVGLKDVQGQRDLSANQTCATHAKQEIPITGETRQLHINPWASMVSGRGSRASAANPFIAMACAPLAIASNTSLRSTLLNRTALGVSNHDTASRLINTKLWCLNAVASATFAKNHLPLGTRALIGMASCASTIATIAERFADSCVTTATLLLDTARAMRYSFALQSTYDCTADEIVEIFPDGREEVFDVEVERTENFIANGIVSHNTRWSKRDLTGQILKKSSERTGSDEWEVIEFPAIMPSGTPLWPEFWSLEELEAIKAEIPVSKWNAQYMQDPTSEEGALIKREWWREWPSEQPPPVEAIIQSWDTAFLKTQRSDYSACTTWGIFHQENEEGVVVPNLILLDAFKDKMEFPELKRVAHQKYWEYEPDQLVVEKKASGAPLIAELRMMGIPVTEFTPVRGNDKIARANAVTDLFASGIVWHPPTRWAEEVIEECASFPAGEHDDYVDSVTQALIRFRQGGWLRTTMDEWYEEPGYRRPVEFY